jgi:hypothetical protein
MTRVPPSVRMREAVDHLLHGAAAEGEPAGPPLHGFGRQVAQ